MPGGIVGDAAGYLVEGGQAQVALHEGVPIAVDLPASMVLTITKTDPGVKGDTRTGAFKPATLETGSDRPGPAVRRGGREDQGRHALGRVHRTREGVTTRREARRTALDILYQADITDAPGERVLSDWVEAGRTVPAFAGELVIGVVNALREEG